jgi:hypothetical protein
MCEQICPLGFGKIVNRYECGRRHFKKDMIKMPPSNHEILRAYGFVREPVECINLLLDLRFRYGRRLSFGKIKL